MSERFLQRSQHALVQAMRNRSEPTTWDGTSEDRDGRCSKRVLQHRGEDLYLRRRAQAPDASAGGIIPRAEVVYETR